MKLINVKILQDQSVGISDSYYRPTEDELLDEYLDAVPFLTISHEDQLRWENQEIKRSNIEEEKELRALREELEPLLALKNMLIKEGILSEQVSK